MMVQAVNYVRKVQWLPQLSSYSIHEADFVDGQGST